MSLEFLGGQPTTGAYNFRLPMPSKQKINLEKVRASLNTLCPKCGYSIPPEKLYRVDSDHVQCPECGERFIPSVKDVRK
jgi:predicted RNA-binding Zn-ribbon protein involved in translation (DUF1610 family)